LFKGSPVRRIHVNRMTDELRFAAGCHPAANTARTRDPAGLAERCDRDPAQTPTDNMRSIATFARAATGSGTVTWWTMSRSERWTFSSVIIFMKLQTALSRTGKNP